MLSKNIEKALNNQIAMEASASYYYLSIASWCEYEGITGCAKFFYRHSEEERAHMLKIFRYINECGGHAITPEIKKMQGTYKSISEIFNMALKQEQANTSSINGIVEVSLKEKDYPTFNFLQWFVAEQHEEEMVFKTVLDKIEIIGADAKGVFWIDKEVGSIADKMAAS